MDRVTAIAGLRLHELAAQIGTTVPDNLRRDKGWFGQAVETILGASAGSKAAPDFEAIGVELKTLPLNAKLSPKETTFVSSINLMKLRTVSWETSVVRHKLQRVLWLPLEADPRIPLAERRIGQGILWSPSATQEAALKTDWEELTDLMCLGKLETITAKMGRYLQVPPKGANARALALGVNEFGETVQTLPRGFYLRTQFTEQVLQY